MPLPVTPTYLPDLRVRVVHNNSSSVSAALANPSLTLVVSKATIVVSGTITKVISEIELIVEEGGIVRRFLIWKIPEVVGLYGADPVHLFVIGGQAIIKVTGDLVAIIEGILNKRTMKRVNSEVVAIIEQKRRMRTPITLLLHAVFPRQHQHIGPYEDT